MFGAHAATNNDNIPITENEDYPIMYGRSLSAGDDAICFQYGKMFRNN